MATDLAKILRERRSTGKVDRPKPLPVGTYLAKVLGEPMPEYGQSEQKGTPFVKFTLEIIEAGSDIEEDALNEWAERADGSQRTLQGTQMFHTLWLTDDAFWRFDKFCEDCGVLEEDKGIEELVESCVGCEVNVYITHTRAKNDRDVTYANIKDTAAVE